jgi:hypothetical protein
MDVNAGNAGNEQVRVLSTNPDDPTAGRIFVWTKMGWFERIQGQTGAVAFTHIAESTTEVRSVILRKNPEADLYELTGKIDSIIRKEFLDQSRSSPASPEDSIEDFRDDREQTFHQHD